MLRSYITKVEIIDRQFSNVGAFYKPLWITEKYILPDGSGEWFKIA